MHQFIRKKEMGYNGVRKGAWTKDEDILLKNCIQMYGEGNWHKVPPRAGLNRCRKSCRLRWLNYLRPNLKRGFFTKDEVDLVLRLHKLLGNRWSLIAGRLPGRTGNDVKNFWNTHIVKKSSASDSKKTTQKIITAKNIIKPRPRTFSKPAWLSQSNNTNEAPSKDQNVDNTMKASSSSASLLQEEANDCKNGEEFPSNNLPFSLSEKDVDECIQWWSNLLDINENNEGIPFSDHSHGGPIMQSDQANNQIDKDGSSSLSVDADVWGFLGLD